MEAPSHVGLQRFGGRHFVTNTDHDVESVHARPLPRERAVRVTGACAERRGSHAHPRRAARTHSPKHAYRSLSRDARRNRVRQVGRRDATRRSDRHADTAEWWQPRRRGARRARAPQRSEEHTSELQSQSNLVCRLLLEKKKHLRHAYTAPLLPETELYSQMTPSTTSIEIMRLLDDHANMHT